MKAISQNKYGGPEVLTLVETEKPMPLDNEVLIKTDSVSINPYEWHHMRGRPLFMRLMVGIIKPKNKVLGNDVSGTVVMLGKNVKGFTVGDRVFGSCGFKGLAEYTCVPADKLLTIPAMSTLEEAAALPIAGLTALQALRDYGKIESGQKVLINGAAGGVGTFSVQLAKYYGAEVTAVCSTQNVDMVKRLGADHVIDYTREELSNDKSRYDLVLDNVGNLNVKKIKSLLKARGRGVVVGFTSMKILLDVMIRGSRNGQWIGTVTAKVIQEDQQLLKQLIEDGHLKPEIDRTYPLSETAKAIAYLETGHARAKVIVKPNQN